MRPFRVDLVAPPEDAIDRLAWLGALDIDLTDTGLAAILPDRLMNRDAIATALGMRASDVTISEAVARDDASTWLLRPRPIRVGRLLIVTNAADGHAPSIANASASPVSETSIERPSSITLTLNDRPAFGSGFHPTTMLCLGAVEEAISLFGPERVLDVGTGSGILALAALSLGVPKATGVDVDADALDVAAENARHNALSDRLELVQGDATSVIGMWPLVVANIAAAPLIEMAPALVQRLDHRGRLVLAGIPSSVGGDVERVYRRAGLHLVRTDEHNGWKALILEASW